MKAVAILLVLFFLLSNFGSVASDSVECNGSICTIPNGFPSCENDVCSIGHCYNQYDGCTGSTANCNTSLTTVTYCGSCVTSCQESQICVAYGQVYSNGPYTGLCDINMCAKSMDSLVDNSASDSFIVTGLGPVEDGIVSIDSLHVVFWIPFDTSFQSVGVEIGTDPFANDVYYQAQQVAESRILLGQSNDSLYQIYKITFLLENVQILSNSTYYLTLSNVSGYAAWDVNDGPSTAYLWTNPKRETSSHSFNVDTNDHVCRNNVCPSGFASCDGASSCDTWLLGDVNNCGTCNNNCTNQEAENQVATCEMGVCTFTNTDTGSSPTTPSSSFRMTRLHYDFLFLLVLIL